MTQSAAKLAKAHDMWNRGSPCIRARWVLPRTNVARVTRKGRILPTTCSPTRVFTKSFTDSKHRSQASASGELRLSKQDDGDLTRLLTATYSAPESAKESSDSNNHLSASLTYRNAAQHGRLEPRPNQVMEKFSQTLPGSMASMSNHLAAATAVARQHPWISGWVRWDIPLEPNLLEHGYGNRNRVRIKYWNNEIRFTMPKLQIKQKPSRNDLAAPLARVKLFARGLRIGGTSLEPTVGLSGSCSMESEVKRTAQWSANVLQRVWDELLFDSYEAASQAMAEALARVLEFVDPDLVMFGVHLDLYPPKDTGLKVSTAQVFTNSAEDVFSIKTWEKPAKDAKFSDDALSGDSSGLASATSRSMTRQTASKKVSPEDKTENRPRTLAANSTHFLHCKEHASELLERSLGLHRSAFEIAWSTVSHEKPDVTVDDVRKTIENKVASCSEKGWQYIRIAAQALLDVEPRPCFSKLTLNSNVSASTKYRPISAPKVGLSVALKGLGSDAERLPTLDIELSRAFRVNFGRPEARKAMKVTLRGQMADGEESSPLQKLSETMIDMVQRSVQDRHFADIRDVTHTVGNALLKDSEKFATLLKLEDVLVEVLVDKRQQESGLWSNLRSTATSPATSATSPPTPTLIALGSNLGDRLSCIEEACRALDAESNIRIVRTSSLYETKAMYVEDQAPFLNGVCEIETSLKPEELLDRTQAIEQNLGRVKTIDKGPRNIDLDILLHGDHVVDTDRLKIPHALMHERGFVLWPMFDVTQMAELQHPITRRKFLSHFKKLPPADTPSLPLVSLGEGCRNLSHLDPVRKTAVMSILNVTPDSFSDGGDNLTTDHGSLKELVRSHIASDVTIIDVGGQSSRPNAPDVTAEEEISRIIPAIQAIKSLPEAAGVAISVDTYRAAVAEAAINAGAHIINDISAGLLDENMLPTIARLGCTYIMMHMRGTPATMMSEENCSYPDGLIETVRKELEDRVDAAQAAGIRRWRIILDPGIGFSKTTEQNLEILRRLGELSTANRSKLSRMPWLVGTSRKSFIGKITGVEEPKERSWGTAATITEAIRKGADIVRVHDVAGMAKVAKMADALYRN